MAALTWRNVSAPDLSTSVAGIRNAGELLNGAFGGLNKSLQKYDGDVSDRVNSAFTQEFLKYQDADALQAALAADPTLGFDRKRISTESAQNASQQVGSLLDQAGQRTDNETGVFDLGVKQYDQTRTVDKDTRMDAARPDFSKFVQAAASGDRREASRILAESPTLADMDQDSFLAMATGGQKLVSGEVNIDGDIQDQMIQGNEEVRNQGRFSQDNARFQWDQTDFDNRIADRDVMIAAETAANEALLGATDGAGALGKLEQMIGPGTDPRVMSLARGIIGGQFGGSLFGNAGGGGGGDNPATSGGSASPGSTNIKDMLRESEGFRTETYWDVDHHRTGYGSDTITRADGSVVKVRKGMKVTREDAERDLDRRVSGLNKVGRQKVGKAWDDLPEGARSAIMANAYNYGEGHKRLGPLWAAAKTGDVRKISAVIRGFAGDNNGVNRERRMSEAAIALSGRGGVSPETAAISARAERGNINNAGNTNQFDKDRNSSVSPTGAAKWLRKKIPNVPVKFFTETINDVVRRGTKEDGTQTINNAQAARMILQSYGQGSESNFQSLINRVGLGRDSYTPNIGTQDMRIDDQKLANYIDLAKSGEQTNRQISMQEAGEGAQSIAQISQTVSALQSRVSQLRSQAIRRPSIARPGGDLDQAEAELAAALLAQQSVQGNVQAARNRR